MEREGLPPPFLSPLLSRPLSLCISAINAGEGSGDPSSAPPCPSLSLFPSPSLSLSLARSICLSLLNSPRPPSRSTSSGPHLLTCTVRRRPEDASWWGRQLLRRRNATNDDGGGVWKWPREDNFDPPSPANVDGGSWIHKVPFDPTIVMVPLVHNESGRISKHVFRDKMSKLWQWSWAKRGLIFR